MRRFRGLLLLVPLLALADNLYRPGARAAAENRVKDLQGALNNQESL